MSNNIHPDFQGMVQRSERERVQGHRAGVFWMTGLSGSGKSTVAKKVERQLFDQGLQVKMLDGDNIRTGISSNLGFSSEDRQENIRRIAEVARLFLDTNVIVIASFISPTRSIRKMAAEIIGRDDFFEIFVDAPLEVCEERDVKGLYEKARSGEINNFTGIDAPYEPPETPFLHLRTDQRSVEASAQACLQAIEARVKDGGAEAEGESVRNE